MVIKQKKGAPMLLTESPLSALEETRQLNRLFLGFLRERPADAVDRFGLPASAAALLANASRSQVEHAASFPRALFRLHLPPQSADVAMDPLSLARGTQEQVLKRVVLNSARNFSRMSGYSARLLLRLTDEEVARIRVAEVHELVALSGVDGVLGTAFVELGWLWRELLTEDRPEYRRRLLLIGLQPEFLVQPAPRFA